MLYTKSPILNFIAICFLLFLIPVFSLAVNVKDFGAKGDGVADDTRAINAAIRGANDGQVEFPRGTYRITSTIEIQLSENGTTGLAGRGGSAGIVMAGSGPAFRFTGSHDKGSALPSSVNPITWQKERMPLIDALEIIGAHPNADGIELRNTLMPVLRALLIRNVRNGIHLSSRNRNVLIDA
ncbi:glycosyl hydrolase family 28-related protein [Daejeonella sp. H1SJ63]|uniref:glycosyl hydrolase family 28-related protein n=1 Tax=Daejeonella sp. H1SJ63 TaxID=3034145 RepID=UPI0023EDC65C|nr:glycosyl hydrolase family 28-related protein [Daejeonella sp. H1SJ63]